MTMRLQAACTWLVDLVDAGYEFPEAHEKTVWRFRLNDEDSGKIVELYDAHQQQEATA